MRSQPNSSSFYISAALCGVPSTSILDGVSDYKLCNTKHIFQLDVSIPNVNLLWWVEAKRMLRGTNTSEMADPAIHLLSHVHYLPLLLREQSTLGESGTFCVFWS